MAKKTSQSKSSKQAKLREALRRFVRAKGSDYLKDPNVTSIGVGRKNGDGPESIVFTVGEKVELEVLERLDTKALPAEIEVEGFTVPTDVVERKYEPSYKLVETQTLGLLKTRLDPVLPGASVSHIKGTAGTLGMMVFDRETGAPCILSNWHVLHGNRGAIGDEIVQPGPFDDNNTAGNVCGELLRSHLGAAGDCALARLRSRDFEQAIHNLDVVPKRMARVELDDTVVKTGRHHANHLRHRPPRRCHGQAQLRDADRHTRNRLFRDRPRSGSPCPQ